MRKFDIRKLRLKLAPDVGELDGKTILLNLLITQLLTFVAGAAIILFQEDNSWRNLFAVGNIGSAVGWGAAFAAVVLLADYAISRRVPEDVVDDGGINRLIFADRPLWLIAAISLTVAFCEELLFRGAIQHAFGPYWTSILFAAVHFRYLRHWLTTGLVFGISYGLGWIFVRTGTLWTTIIAHFIIDFVMGCIIRYRRD
jgi:hypothetical protein